MQLPYRFSPALIAFLVPTIVSQTLITPCSDGQCTNPLTNFTYDGIEAWSPDFGLGSGWPSSTGYENLVFQNASSPDNAEGYTVYWNITSPEPGCRVIFMLPYTEGGYDKVVDNQPEGNIILNVGEPGCYYTNLPVKANLMTTFCCGSGDCGALSAGNPSIAKRAQEDAFTSSLDLAGKGQENDIEIKHRKYDEIKHKRSSPVGSMASRALSSIKRNFKSKDNLFSRQTGTTCTDLACFQAAWSTCNIVAGGSFPAPGNQVAISPAQSCPADTSGVCSFSGAGTLTTGTSLFSITDYSTETSTGVELSVTAGVDWPIDVSTTATTSYSYAQGLAKSTGKQIDKSTSFTVTNTLGQVAGTTAFMTFTPSFTCYEPGIDCSGGTDFDYVATICWPDMLENGVQDGDYNLVYID